MQNLKFRKLGFDFGNTLPDYRAVLAKKLLQLREDQNFMMMVSALVVVGILLMMMVVVMMMMMAMIVLVTIITFVRFLRSGSRKEKR